MILSNFPIGTYLVNLLQNYLLNPKPVVSNPQPVTELPTQYPQ